MSYIGTQPVPQSLESRQEFTATASQTTFATNGYTVGYVDVYLNGVKLSTSDFTATNGSDIVLGSGAAAGDVLAVVMKNDHSDLVALPITDSAGTNVLSESGGVVTLTADGLTVSGATEFQDNPVIKNGSPELTFATTNAAHANWQIAAQESTSNALEIASGQQDADASDDTWTARFIVGYNGNVTITNLGTGTVYSNSGVLTNTNPSDLNLKENVVEVSYGLSEVRQLRPVEFDWIADEADKHELGFIAQEVQLIIPDLVNTYERIINEETGETEIGYGLESTQFIPVLVKAIQEQQSQIDALTARISELETT